MKNACITSKFCIYKINPLKIDGVVRLTLTERLLEEAPH